MTTLSGQAADTDLLAGMDVVIHAHRQRCWKNQDTLLPSVQAAADMLVELMVSSETFREAARSAGAIALLEALVLEALQQARLLPSYSWLTRSLPASCRVVSGHR